LGLREYELEKIPKANRSVAEEAEYQQVYHELEEVAKEYNAFLDQLEPVLNRYVPGEVAYPAKQIVATMRNALSDLRDSGAGEAAFLYTVAAPNSYDVILTTADTQLGFTTTTAAALLNREVECFRSVLQDPNADPVPMAQELHRILFCDGRVDAALAAANVQTLVWSLDGTLRYIPMAALHDGARYLVDCYNQVVITRTTLTQVHKSPKAAWTGLALGVSEAHSVTLDNGGGQKEVVDFDQLDGVPNELCGIISNAEQWTKGVLPGTILLDSQFTERNLLDALEEKYDVVHIASHFRFLPNDRTGSFLLLGDGGTLTLERLKTLPNLFRNVDLLTLSACDTAMAGSAHNDELKGQGYEVDSLAEVAQEQGAVSVMATLWRVEDSSTALLMQQFYKRHATSPQLGKAEALRQAQLGLLHGNLQSVEPAGGGLDVPLHVEGGQTTDTQFSHPYYWAPFILMGNWR
jgi:CHAT domain-containing protein